jgi:hypothetical protein
VLSKGVTIKVDAESDGHDYRLAGFRTGPITGGHRRLTLAVPAGRVPVLVLGGTSNSVSNADTATAPSTAFASRSSIVGRGSDPRTGSVRIFVDGDLGSVGAAGGLATTSAQDARAHTLQLRVDAGLTGTMVLGYYVRTD